MSNDMMILDKFTPNSQLASKYIYIYIYIYIYMYYKQKLLNTG